MNSDVHIGRWPSSLRMYLSHKLHINVGVACFEIVHALRSYSDKTSHGAFLPQHESCEPMEINSISMLFVSSRSFREKCCGVIRYCIITVVLDCCYCKRVRPARCTLPAISALEVAAGPLKRAVTSQDFFAWQISMGMQLNYVPKDTEVFVASLRGLIALRKLTCCGSFH